MDVLTRTRELLKGAAAKIAETASFEEVANYIPQDVVDDANMHRLIRLADANYARIEAEHLTPIQNSAAADRAVDMYDAGYLLDLSLSYIGISDLCRALISAVKKQGVQPPHTWQAFSEGTFPYEEELEAGSN